MKLKNETILETEMNCEIAKVQNWLLANRLSVHYIKKSQFMLIDWKSTHSEINSIDDFTLEMGGHPLTKTTSYKYLGIYIDNKLSWDIHINNIIKKLSQVAGVIFKNRECLSKKSLMLVYNSLVNSRLRYGLCTWGTASKGQLKGLNQIHDKIIRFMTFSKPCANCQPLYKSLEILPLESLLQLEQAKFMFKSYQKSLPAVFSTYVSKPNHNYSTSYARSSNFSMVHSGSSTKVQKSIRYLGPKIWASTPFETKQSTSVKMFSVTLKKYLVENMFPD